ncbi:MAG: hypothetical protein JWL69_1962 [Phycisphaerales bacterium]|jgi:hypothetical protein|nr:hypothetical protein [Phycisphaerales bacterium]
MGAGFFARRTVAGLLCSAFLLAGGQGCASSHSDKDIAREARAEGESYKTEKREHERAAQPYYNDGYQDSDEDLENAIFSEVGTGFIAAVGTIIDVPSRTIAFFNGDTPSLAARRMEDAASADNRRSGMVKLADDGFTKIESFKARCRQLALYDKDPTVRATAIRTSNRARDSKAAPVFTKALDDRNEWVRLEAAKALANVPDMGAIEPLIRTFNNREESRDVRVAAADALKHYRSLQVVRALTGSLNDREFAIAWQSRKSLKYITSHDYGYDERAWLAYFTGPEKPLG